MEPLPTTPGTARRGSCFALPEPSFAYGELHSCCWLYCSGSGQVPTTLGTARSGSGLSGVCICCAALNLYNQTVNVWGTLSQAGRCPAQSCLAPSPQWLSICRAVAYDPLAACHSSWVRHGLGRPGWGEARALPSLPQPLLSSVVWPERPRGCARCSGPSRASACMEQLGALPAAA